MTQMVNKQPMVLFTLQILENMLNSIEVSNAGSMHKLETTQAA